MSCVTYYTEPPKGKMSPLAKNVLVLRDASDERIKRKRNFPGEEWKTIRVQDNKDGLIYVYALSTYGRLANTKTDYIYPPMKAKTTMDRKDFCLMRYVKPVKIGGLFMSNAVSSMLSQVFPEYSYDPDDIFSQEGEEWRPIKGDYVKIYYISNYGRIKTTGAAVDTWHYLKSDRLSPDGEVKMTSRASLLRNNGRKPRVSVHKLLSENFPEALIEAMKTSIPKVERYEDEVWVNMGEGDYWWLSNYGRRVYFNLDEYTLVFSRFTVYNDSKKLARENIKKHLEKFTDGTPQKIEEVIDYLTDKAYERAIERTPKDRREALKKVAANKRGGVYEVLDRRKGEKRYYQALDELANVEGFSLQVAEELLYGLRLEHRGKKIYYRGQTVGL